MLLRLHDETKAAPPQRAFTLLELIVTMAILGMIILLVARIMGGASDAWLRIRGNSATFESANAAFDVLSRNFAQATLNTYWEYDPPTAPTRFRRASDLHFLMGPGSTLPVPGGAELTTSIAFFQAPLGQEGNIRRLPELLNGVGYFIRFDQGQETPSFLDGIVSPRWRFRLYEWIEPASSLAVYRPYSTGGGNTWITNRLFSGNASGTLNNVAVLAENIIGVILMAEYPNSAGTFTKSYIYDSRNPGSPATENQLPPRVHVVMVAIDEASASRLAQTYGTTAPPVLPDAAWFTNPSEFNDDLDRWKAKLQGLSPRPNYTILNATVTIENSRWNP